MSSRRSVIAAAFLALGLPCAVVPAAPSLVVGPAAWGEPALRPDTVALKPRHVTDRKLTYTLKSRIEIPQQDVAAAQPPSPEPASKPADGGDAKAPRDAAPAAPAAARYFRMEATMKVTTLGTDEQGNASMVVLLSNLIAEMGVGGTPQAGLTLTDSGLVRKDDQKTPEPGPAPSSAAMPDDTPLAAVTSALMASTIRIDVRPDGTISDLTGLEDAHAIAAKHADGARLLGPFAPGVVSRFLAALFRVDEPDKTGAYIQRGPASTWTLLDEWDLSSRSTLVRTTTCTLDSLTPDLATITAKGQAAIRTAPALTPPPDAAPRRGKQPPADDFEPIITIAEQGDESTVEWNPAEGVLLSRVRRSSIATRATLGDHVGPLQVVRSTTEIRLQK